MNVDRKTILLSALFLTGASVFWALGPVAIKYLTPHIDAYTQNFFRYFSAAVLMVVWLGSRLARRGIRLPRSGSEWALVIAPGLFNALLQTFWAMAYYHEISPTVGTLIFNTNVIFVAAMEFLIAPEERRRILNPWSVGGLLAILIGSAGVAAFGPSQARTHSIAAGVMLVLASSVCWAFYGLSVKRPSRRFGATLSFAYISIGTTVALGIVAVLFGNPGRIVSAPPRAVAVVILSGVLCLAFGHVLFIKSVQMIGVAIPNGVVLSAVLVTHAVSYFLFDERLTALQWLAAALLLAGCLATLFKGTAHGENIGVDAEPKTICGEAPTS